jgi:hypothetical protein
MMRKPLITRRCSEGPSYFRLYECEHITDGSYPLERLYLGNTLT